MSKEHHDQSSTAFISTIIQVLTFKFSEEFNKHKKVTSWHGKCGGAKHIIAFIVHYIQIRMLLLQKLRNRDCTHF